MYIAGSLVLRPLRSHTRTQDYARTHMIMPCLVRTIHITSHRITDQTRRNLPLFRALEAPNLRRQTKCASCERSVRPVEEAKSRKPTFFLGLLTSFGRPTWTPRTRIRDQCRLQTGPHSSTRCTLDTITRATQANHELVDQFSFCYELRKKTTSRSNNSISMQNTHTHTHTHTLEAPALAVPKHANA